MTEDERFDKLIETSLRNAMAMKKKMQALGIRDANVKCPEKKCQGRLHMHIEPRKNHARMWCTGTCGQNLME